MATPFVNVRNCILVVGGSHFLPSPKYLLRDSLSETVYNLMTRNAAASAKKV